jgi:hypothetical protein
LKYLIPYDRFLWNKIPDEYKRDKLTLRVDWKLFKEHRLYKDPLFVPIKELCGKEILKKASNPDFQDSLIIKNLCPFLTCSYAEIAPFYKREANPEGYTKSFFYSFVTQDWYKDLFKRETNDIKVIVDTAYPELKLFDLFTKIIESKNRLQIIQEEGNESLKKKIKDVLYFQSTYPFLKIIANHYYSVQDDLFIKEGLLKGVKNSTEAAALYIKSIDDLKDTSQT